MVYDPLYHVQGVATINCFMVALEMEISKAYQYYLIVFNKTSIPLISNVHLWNNIVKYNKYRPCSTIVH